MSTSEEMIDKLGDWERKATDIVSEKVMKLNRR
jgi:hypothetical protein